MQTNNQFEYVVLVIVFVHIIEQNESILQMTHHVFSSDYASSTAIICTVRLTICSGFNTTRALVLKLSQSQYKTYYHTRGTCLYLHWRLPAASFHSWKILFSTFIIFHSWNLTATCCLNIWLTHQLLTDSIGTLSKWYHSVHSYVCAYTCISNTYTYLLSCRGQPSELDIPWSDIQRIGSLSCDSFFVSCLNLEDILSLLPVAGHLKGWYIIYLLFSCLNSSTIETNSIRLVLAFILKKM